MKLTMNRRTDAHPFLPTEAHFAAPGGTIGRSSENLLRLADESGRICRVQAAVRYTDGGWRLANLSSMTDVSVNGQALAPAHDRVLENGDELTIGPYVLLASAVGADAGTDGEQADVFGDLIGPGTLPVASMSALSVHPFDMESETSRNPDDPLAQLPADGWRQEDGQRDPLALFPDSGHRMDHPLADPTPAMLPADDPLAWRRSDPVTDALRRRGGEDGQPAMRDDTPEYGNPMTPPKVRR
jgi:FHA domain-containing protein